MLDMKKTGERVAPIWEMQMKFDAFELQVYTRTMVEIFFGDFWFNKNAKR